MEKLSKEQIESQRKLGDEYYKSNPNKSEVKKLSELYQSFEMKKEKSREIKSILNNK